MNIAVLTSGGVDSSVALARLVREGHRPTAFYLKIWLEDELAWLGTCPWQEDVSFVQEVCAHLNVPLEILNLQREYHEHIVAYTLEQIRTGYTPNPDIMCNVHIKFGTFFKHIGTSYDTVATGHYAQIDKKNGLTQLLMSGDPIKDQTYFLSRLGQEQLKRALFPIGHLCKTQVRELAHEYHLSNKERKDSQGICFLGKIKFREFLKHHLGTQKGELIEHETGVHVGTHEGVWFYTIGQRQGIGLSGGPWYVVSKDHETNTVFVSRSYYAPSKGRSSVQVTKFNWITGQQPIKDVPLHVKLRHGPALTTATLTFHHDDQATVTLAERDQGIAPGQFVVFYQERVCLGSALIVPEKIT